MTVPVLGPEEIEAAARPALVLDAVRAALIAHAAGRTTVPPPTHLTFPAADGDCHVKTGWIDGSDDFTVKIASGFYRNPERGEPVNHGLVCVISAHTGRVRAVLDDGGRLTAWRTAAAGALAGHALARPEARSVGVFGTGEQARLQVRWLAMLRPVGRVLVHGRDARRAAALCEHLAAHGLSAGPASAAEAAGADIVVTATPATSPVLDADAVRPGAHVTAVGADMPHKNELPPALFARAGVIATDDHEQCLHHGDLAHAVRAGAVPHDADVPLGALLRTPQGRGDRTDATVTIADLTGVGALDAAVAAAVVRELLG
ncbi:ornithine cyclodeaminase family protein [Streptomyces sp. PA03-6a]|nr:ornithine cyclodeaminase family protein [Streptomyces sp. PA03-6a]